ncbi:MAG TPA: IS21 family transposase [Ktedonobacteraceae bacterium]|nr:IS21 family transposase [Ktedonobacteraceae bacterium]
MKNDCEIKLYMSLRQQGKTQKVAAARSGMSERTARKYEQAGKLPSELKRPHDWQTRPNPFEDDWAWIVEQLERDPALQSTTLFALVCERHPDKYRPTQDRTLRRHIARWKALHGPSKEVIFEQVQVPGERGQSDFTHMEDLNLTLAGVPFPHLLYHFVLTYSNVEVVNICFSETFEALAEGIERALWQIGGAPAQHRTDHLSAAVRHLPNEEREDWTARYQALMGHYGITPTWNNAGVAHENGEVEQAHDKFKNALDQALRVRGSRDFASRSDYEHFLQNLVYKRNQNPSRTTPFLVEKQALRPLPAAALAPCREVEVTASRFSTIMVGGNIYSVPSRLIGMKLRVRLRSEVIQGYLGTSKVFEFPRQIGRHRHRIDYHHLAGSLVRKPGAFAHYRYREELFPTTTFRRAYDQLQKADPKRADREYVRLLHLAATKSEAEVETALQIVLEECQTPLFLTVRDLVQMPGTASVPQLTTPNLNLSPYDQLIPSTRSTTHA